MITYKMRNKKWQKMGHFLAIYLHIFSHFYHHLLVTFSSCFYTFLDHFLSLFVPHFIRNHHLNWLNLCYKKVLKNDNDFTTFYVILRSCSTTFYHFLDHLFLLFVIFVIIFNNWLLLTPKMIKQVTNRATPNNSELPR